VYTAVVSLALLAGAAGERPAVAMVLKVQGQPTRTRNQGTPQRLWVMDRLHAGDRLVVPPAGSLLLFFDDGHKERVLPGRTVTVTVRGCDPGDAVERLKDPRLPRRALAGLRDELHAGRMGGASLRGGPGKASLPVLTPLPGSVVLTGRPDLSWPAVPGAEGYAVQLATGPAGPEEVRLWRVETKENHLPFPEKQPALKEFEHRWAVTARLKGGEDKQVVDPGVATFTVALPSERKLLAALKPLAQSSDVADLLLAASTYESRKAYGEALRLYERLAGLLPREPCLQEALANYYERAGRHDAAQKARERARALRAGRGSE
jgi:hypothetical protein